MFVTQVKVRLEGPEEDLRHVDAVPRVELVLGLEVDRRKADLPPHPVSLRDDAVHREGAPQEAPSLGDVPRLQEAPHPRRRDRLPAFEHDVERLHADPGLLAEPGEEGDVAALSAAEREGRPDVDLARSEPPAQEVADELLGRHRGELPRERDDDEGVDAELGDRLFALPERLDQPRRPLRVEDPHRVRVERQDDRRGVELPGPLDDAAEHLLVPEVDAVEVPDRQDAPPREVRALEGVDVDVHGGRGSHATTRPTRS